MYPMPFDNPTTYPGHGGIDYPQPKGTLVRATASGVVTFSGWWNDRAGNTRTITTAEGFQVIDCHLESLEGRPVGSRIEVGDPFARVGSTGHSTGPHLHQEIWKNGVKYSGNAYWNIVDRNAVVSARVEGGEDMILNIIGKRGVREAGAYYIAGGQATRLGPFVEGAIALDEARTQELAKQVKGL